MKYEAEGDRAQVDERRTDEPEVCHLRLGGSGAPIASRITRHAVSLRPPNRRASAREANSANTDADRPVLPGAPQLPIAGSARATASDSWWEPSPEPYRRCAGGGVSERDSRVWRPGIRRNRSTRLHGTGQGSPSDRRAAGCASFRRAHAPGSYD